MPGPIQNAVNQVIRSAMFSARKGVPHAGQTGKDPSASGEAAPLVAPSAPKASEIAANVARENLTDKRNSNKMNQAIIAKWAKTFQETPESMQAKLGKLAKKGDK